MTLPTSNWALRHVPSLTNVVTETVFPIARFVEAPLHRLLLSTGETHVAGERRLAADARRPPANARDRNDRSATQPHKHVRKLLQARGTRRKSRSVLGLREEILVCQEESIDGELASLILHGYSLFFTSAGVIALGCFVSLVRRVSDCT
jgi:hypothetical protein